MPQFQPALVQLWTEMNRNTYVSARGNYQTELLPIPLLPLAEQHRIVAKVDTLLALCDQLEQQLNQADQQRRRLLLPGHARTHPDPGIQVASRRQGRGPAETPGKENF
jgi:uncharacterized membrane protein YccC